MVSPLIRLSHGAFLRRGQRGGFALDVPACRTCSHLCGHFYDFTPDCLAVSFAFDDSPPNTYSCQSGTYYLPWVGCDTWQWTDETYFRSCKWVSTDACLGDYGPFGLNFRRLLEVHVFCEASGYCVGIRMPNRSSGLLYKSNPVPNLFCGDFSVTLARAPDTEDWGLPATCTVTGAHGEEATDWQALFVAGIPFQPGCTNCGAYNGSYYVELSGFPLTTDQGPFCHCYGGVVDPNGLKVATIGNVCVGDRTWDYRYGFAIPARCFMTLDLGTNKYIAVRVTDSCGPGWVWARFRGGPYEDLDCQDFDKTLTFLDHRLWSGASAASVRVYT